MLFTWFFRYADFGGRSSRKEFWLGFLCLVLISCAASILDMVVFGGWSHDGAGPLRILSSLVTVIPSLALSVRRLHDIGRTGWWVLLNLIPLIGQLVLLFWACQPGQPTANQFGSAPPETPNRVAEEAEAAA